MRPPHKQRLQDQTIGKLTSPAPTITEAAVIIEVTVEVSVEAIIKNTVATLLAIPNITRQLGDSSTLTHNMIHTMVNPGINNEITWIWYNVIYAINMDTASNSAGNLIRCKHF